MSKRSVRIGFVLFALLALPAVAGAQPVRLFLGGAWEINKEAEAIWPGETIEMAPLIEVPKGIRTVPTHPEDGASVPRTVPHNPVWFDTFRPFVGMIGLEARPVNYVRIRGGATFSATSESIDDRFRNTWEIGQFTDSTERGGGTSLVFYSIRPKQPSIGYFTEGQLGSFIGLVVGYQWSPGDYVIRSGWDRFNSLETYKTYGAQAKTKKIYYGLQFDVFAGLSARLLMGTTWMGPWKIENQTASHEFKNTTFQVGFAYSIPR